MAKYKGTLTLPNGRTIDNITADDINNLGLVSDDGEPIGVYGEYLPPNWSEIYDQGYWFGGYFTYRISINNNTYISISMGDFHDQFDENVQSAWEIVCSPENWGDEVIFQNPSEHFNPSTLNFLTNIQEISMATMTQDSTTKLWTLSDTITQPGSYTKTLETKDTYLDGNVKLDLTVDIKPEDFGDAEVTVSGSRDIAYESTEGTIAIDTTGSKAVVTATFPEKIATGTATATATKAGWFTGSTTGSTTSTVAAHTKTLSIDKPAANTIKYGTTILGVQGTLLSDTDIADATSPLVRNGYEFWNHDGDRLYGSMPDSTLGVCADTSHTAALTIDPSTNDQYFKVSEGYTPTRCIKVNKMSNATIILNHANCTISTSASILPTVTLATTKTAGKGYKVNISGSQIITGSHTGGAITLDSTTVAGYITKDSTVTVKAGHTDTISGTATITDPEFYIPEGDLVVSQANCTYAASAAITPTVSLATTKTANGYKVNISGSQAITGTHSGGAITLDSTTTSGYITNGSSITVKDGHTDTITGEATITDPDFYIPAGNIKISSGDCEITPSFSNKTISATIGTGTPTKSGSNYTIPVSLTASADVSGSTTHAATIGTGNTAGYYSTADTAFTTISSGTCSIKAETVSISDSGSITMPAAGVTCTLNEGTRSISGGYLNIPVTASHSFTAGYIPAGTGSGGTATPKVKVYDGSIA